MRFLLPIAVGAAAVVAAVAPASTSRAHLAVAQTSPVVVMGGGFKARERIALTVASKATRTKRIVAGPRGGFTATFRGFSIASCTEYSVRAKGDRGSSAVLRVVPECPAQGVETNPEPGLPTDPGGGKKGH